MKKYLFLGLLLLVMWLGLWAALPLIRGPSVAVVHPIHGPAVQAVYATGTVEATVMMPIATRVAARLAELNVDEGSAVKKGQILARLEDDDVQNSIIELKAREEFARKDYERKIILARRGFVAQATADQAKSDWEAAKAAVARVSTEAGFMRLLAPADGLIIKRDGEIGQLIAVNQPVFWLSCCAPLRISAEVDEEDVALVVVDQKVLIRADAFPGKVFEGTVQAITPKGDPVARSYRVRIGFTDDAPLQIGMTAETNIIIGERTDALLVPAGALTGNRIWLVKNEKLLEQAVTVGAKTPLQVEIINGVTADDMVAISPDTSFRAGKSVHPVMNDMQKP